MNTIEKYFRADRYLPFKILLIFEILWTLVYVSFVIWFQVTNGTGMEAIRDAIIKLAFHSGAPIGILSMLESKEVHLKVVPVFWIWFAVFTDLWSVLDTQLHVAKIVGILSMEFDALSILVFFAISFSGLAAVYYSGLLIWQSFGSQARVAKEMRKRNGQEKDDTYERLMLSGTRQKFVH